eukprot:gb/GECH01003246.1/.p1 GENE.gb/GECH01003246.1/~~gb/GECH01003246.1/.p1  ORF type:complete len:210 (+),score=63.07 gb/GECH01003246.1/:1-630(+)
MKQEQLEIFTVEGNPTGISKDRDAVHKDGDWHNTVHVWIINSLGELLLQQRSPGKESYPLLWDASAAGHISFGETPIEAAIKETKEELGIDIKAEELKKITRVQFSGVTNQGTFVNNEHMDLFIVERDISISSLILQKEEVCDAYFVHFKTLQELIHEKYSHIVPFDVDSNYMELFSYAAKRYPTTSPQEEKIQVEKRLAYHQDESFGQ